MFDSDLGEAKPCLDDFVDFSLRVLRVKGLYLCEFGSQLMECILVTLLTNAGSLKLYVRVPKSMHLECLTNNRSSYVELSLCAIVATFEKTAKVDGTMIWVALQDIDDVNMKICLETLLGDQNQCMAHVRSMQIIAQIMQAQSVLV